MKYYCKNDLVLFDMYDNVVRLTKNEMYNIIEIFDKSTKYYLISGKHEFLINSNEGIMEHFSTIEELRNERINSLW